MTALTSYAQRHSIASMLSRIVNELVKSGLSEQAIVDRLKARGVQVAQSTINRIKAGRIGSPRYDVGVALTDLHKEVTRVPKRRNGKAEAARV